MFLVISKGFSANLDEASDGPKSIDSSKYIEYSTLLMIFGIFVVLVIMALAVYASKRKRNKIKDNEESVLTDKDEDQDIWETVPRHLLANEAATQTTPKSPKAPFPLIISGARRTSTVRSPINREN
eukprot:NODE_11_length_54881_cov_1.430718.p37 type:complete len:126 gc:universal NODE_11_length_54881_cov_1.430718:15232-15609(+)